MHNMPRTNIVSVVYQTPKPIFYDGFQLLAVRVGKWAHAKGPAS